MKEFFRWLFRKKKQLHPKTSRWKAVFRRFARRRRWILFLFLLVTVAFLLGFSAPRSSVSSSLTDFFTPENLPVIIDTDIAAPSPSRKSCSHFTCFDVYRCNALDNYQVSVFVHPETVFTKKEVDLHLTPSKTAKEIRDSIRRIALYTGSPQQACLFFPPVDLLFSGVNNSAHLSFALAASKWWNGGTNNVIFTLKPRHVLRSVQLGSAIIAAPGFRRKIYRRGYDISIPFYYPTSYRKIWPNRSRLDCEKCEDSGISQITILVASDLRSPVHISNFRGFLGSNRRRLLALITIDGTKKSAKDPFGGLATPNSKDILSLSLCVGSDGLSFQLCSARSSWRYPDILLDARFCLVAGSYASSGVLLSDLLMMGCIPVLWDNDVVLPFDENLDWSRSAVFLRPDQLSQAIELLEAIDKTVISELRETGLYFWDQYFSSLEMIVQTVLHALNDRIFPKASRTYEQWNGPAVATKRISHQPLKPPLFLPGIMPHSLGFTAVVLTFDRQDSLFELITLLAKCPSLSKILVVWNNHELRPPSVEKWPKIGKPLKVLQMKENSLNNRFVPYEDIETEAVLSLDDDILMLTVDEIEFGFQVWIEHSDRLIGFPSRLHLWNMTSGLWEYNSEWTSKLSLILTGAAFYNKVYNQLYTHSMEKGARRFVQSHRNCEDIAMNFLIANTTGKGPIKVGPRKKFRCPECSNVDMLSADAGHLLERSQCINYFVSLYGNLPLTTVEYRADPVLYKEDVPLADRRFSEIGAL